MMDYFSDSGDLASFAEEWYRSGMKVAAQTWARMQVPTKHPPKKWWKQAADLGEARVFDGLFAESTCCLDQYISEPLVFKYRCEANTPQEVLESLVLHFLKSRQHTNMARENLLAFFKTSGRLLNCSKPCIERYTYAAELAALMKKHVDRGFPNPLKETRTELLAAGVPVKAAYTGKSKRRDLLQRPDVRWRNIMMHRWRRENPADKDDKESVAAQTRIFIQRWQNMTEVEKRVAMHEVQSEKLAAEATCLEKEEEEDRQEVWCGHNGTWPISSEALKAIMGDQPRQGKYRTVSRRRWQARDSLLAHKLLDFPEGKVNHKYACWEVHPGLCRFADSDVYTRALQFAKDIEHYFIREYEGQYFRFRLVVVSGEDEDFLRVLEPVCMYFASFRGRYFKVPQTHIFCKVEFSLDGSSMWPASGECDVGAWSSVWTLAKELLRTGTRD